MRAQRLAKSAGMLQDTLSSIQNWPVIQQILNWFYKNRVQSEVASKWKDVQKGQQQYQQGMQAAQSASSRLKDPVAAAAVTKYNNMPRTPWGSFRRSMMAKAHPELTSIDQAPMVLDTQSDAWKKDPSASILDQSKRYAAGSVAKAPSAVREFITSPNVWKSEADARSAIQAKPLDSFSADREKWINDWAAKNRKM